MKAYYEEINIFVIKKKLILCFLNDGTDSRSLTIKSKSK